MNSSGSVRRTMRFAALSLVMSTALLTVGCISPSFYVDRSLGDVPPEKRVVVANAKPVQLMFEFQTKGVANARATTAVVAEVTKAVEGSKLFSTVSTAPVAGGAVLNVVINNVPLTEDAASKGFITGLTLGASGTMITDGYTCTVDYLAGVGAPKASTSTRHALHTTIGATEAPQNADPVKTIDEAVFRISRQLVENALNQLAGTGSIR